MLKSFDSNAFDEKQAVKINHDENVPVLANDLGQPVKVTTEVISIYSACVCVRE